MSGVGPVGPLPLYAPHVPEALPTKIPGPTEQPASVPFADILAGAIQSANDKQIAASHAAEAFAAGARDDIHGTMIAVKEADIELKLVANVRNKLLDAFQDLWRLSV
jgi:flagellar hook-basal body complex protein FliE